MLQPMMQGLQTYFKDSFAFKAKLDTFVIPPRGRLFTCDADGMYPNIETDIAMASIATFLKDKATHTANEMIVRTIVRIFPYYHVVCTSLVCMF